MGGGGEEEEQGRKVNVLKGVIIGVLGNRGRAWVDSQTLPPPPPRSIAQKGKINIFFEKEQKERKVRDSKQREGASRLPHTAGKQKPTKKNSFFQFHPLCIPFQFCKNREKDANFKKSKPTSRHPPHPITRPTPPPCKTKQKQNPGDGKAAAEEKGFRLWQPLRV